MNLLDERDGRKVAKSLGLKVTGVLGILLRAKQKGELFSLVESVDALVTTAGFRIAPDLLAKDLQIVFQVLNKSCCPSSNKLCNTNSLNDPTTIRRLSRGLNQPLSISTKNASTRRERFHHVTLQSPWEEVKQRLSQSR